ncbi:MAG: hypothetical protein HY508_11570 [Acidobacteria bacterium]|nr:hypothetical protein [Acidobacteriota bacterium]
MRTTSGLILTLVLLAACAAAQSLGDIARKEKERKAQQERKPAVTVETDALRKGKVELAPRLEPTRKGDLDYLVQQLSHPRPTSELLSAFVPLKDQAIPRVATLLLSAEPTRRIAPAAVLTVLGSSEGLGAMARMLDESIATAKLSAPKDDAEKGSAESAAAFQQKMEAMREANLSMDVTRVGVWRFTEGSALTPDQVVKRVGAGPPIEIVGGLDNGQKLFSRALRDSDGNLRAGAIALIRAASGGNDFGYRISESPDANEVAIQAITTFLTTERAKVVAALRSKPTK